jgi:radical SAM modification target selenobiotic family peptide
MERDDLKKILAGVSLATLMTGGLIAFSAQPAASA